MGQIVARCTIQPYSTKQHHHALLLQEALSLTHSIPSKVSLLPLPLLFARLPNFCLAFFPVGVFEWIINAWSVGAHVHQVGSAAAHWEPRWLVLHPDKVVIGADPAAGGDGGGGDVVVISLDNITGIAPDFSSAV